MESDWQNSFTYVVVVVIHAEDGRGRTLIADVDVDFDEDKEGGYCWTVRVNVISQLSTITQLA